VRRVAALGFAGLLVGLAVAIGIWAFKRAIDLAQWLSHGWFADDWTGVGTPWIVFIPAVGGLIVGVALHVFRQPEEPGHGVAEVIETVTLGSSDFPERRTPLKAMLAAVSLGSGASLGPEDPAVEIGGGTGSFLSRRLGMGVDDQQALVAAGAAAGLSAAFHAPLAAVVFAVEVFTLKLRSTTIVIVALCCAAAFGVARRLDPVAEPLIPGHGVAGWEETGLALGIGLLAGVVTAAQIKLMYSVEHAVIDWRTVPRWLKPALGGAVLGAVALVYPELLGIGYETIEPVVAGERLVLGTLLLLAVGKLLLMTVSFGTGFPGGFFAPCLFIGATAGAACGVAAAGVVPDVRPEVLALAGMAAILAGCVRAPFSAVLLLAALSGSYGLVPLLLAGALPAHLVSRRLERYSLYTYGITHPTGKAAPDHPDGTPQSDASGGMDAAS
jgi:chloride channel protein, CIC family